MFLRHSFLRVLLLISGFFFLSQFWHFISSPRIPNGPEIWTFDPDRHANLHTLNQEQCDSAFPELYHSLTKAVKLRGKRPIMPRDLEIRPARCMMRLLIYDREVSYIAQTDVEEVDRADIFSYSY
jgi:hypothetical protein